MTTENMNDALSEIFGVEVEPATFEDKRGALTIIPEVETSDDDLETMDHDHQNARKNLSHLIQQGHEALEYALLIAKESESPRAFEVVAGLIKSISDVNTQLLDTHRTKQQMKINELKKNGDKSISNTTTNNCLFVGSTAELSKMISNMKREN